MNNKIKTVVIVASGVVAGAIVGTKLVKTIKARKEQKNKKKSVK